jgi:hypothetical protein
LFWSTRWLFEGLPRSFSRMIAQPSQPRQQAQQQWLAP